MQTALLRPGPGEAMEQEGKRESKESKKERGGGQRAILTYQVDQDVKS